MPYFNESQLEQSIIALLQEQGYAHVRGEDIVRNLDEVVLRDDLAEYLRNRYKNDCITTKRWRLPSASSCSKPVARSMTKTSTPFTCSWTAFR